MSTPYATTAEMNTYMATRFDHFAWDDANSDERTRALATATRLIDTLNFAGEKNDADQANEFPRTDDLTIPTKIKEATYEIAFELLDGKDPGLELENLGQVQVFYEQVRARYDRTTVPEHLAHGIPSALAWSYLKPFLRDARSVALRRVS